MSHCIIHYGDTIKGFDVWDLLEEWLMRPAEMFGVDDPLLDVIHESGNILTVGLAPGCGTLDFSRQSLELPFATSVTEEATPDDANRGFALSDGDRADIPLRNCIPRAAAIAAVREFFDTGERPESITWEEE